MLPILNYHKHACVPARVPNAAFCVLRGGAPKHISGYGYCFFRLQFAARKSPFFHTQINELYMWHFRYVKIPEGKAGTATVSGEVLMICWVNKCLRHVSGCWGGLNFDKVLWFIGGIWMMFQSLNQENMLVEPTALLLLQHVTTGCLLQYFMILRPYLGR